MKIGEKYLAKHPIGNYTFEVKDETIEEGEKIYLIEILDGKKKGRTSYIFQFEIDNTLQLLNNNKPRKNKTN